MKFPGIPTIAAAVVLSSAPVESFSQTNPDSTDAVPVHTLDAGKYILPESDTPKTITHAPYSIPFENKDTLWGMSMKEFIKRSDLEPEVSERLLALIYKSAFRDTIVGDPVLQNPRADRAFYNPFLHRPVVDEYTMMGDFISELMHGLQHRGSLINFWRRVSAHEIGKLFHKKPRDWYASWAYKPPRHIGKHRWFKLEWEAHYVMEPILLKHIFYGDYPEISTMSAHEIIVFCRTTFLEQYKSQHVEEK